MAQRTQLQRRRKPRKKPPAKGFIDTVLEMLGSTAGTVMAGAGVVLLGRILGEPVRGRIELPPGLPPEIEAEWLRLAGIPPDDADAKPEKTGGRRKRIREPPAEVVNLKKGPDGVYRPEETE